jgi:hypothetical protein
MLTLSPLVLRWCPTVLSHIVSPRAILLERTSCTHLTCPMMLCAICPFAKQLTSKIGGIGRLAQSASQFYVYLRGSCGWRGLSVYTKGLSIYPRASQILMCQ